MVVNMRYKIDHVVGKYTVFEDGRVLSPKGVFLKPQFTGSAKYKCVHLGAGGKIRLHRLVAILFVENPNGHNEVNHKDGNKNNNESSNLEWASRAENMQHAVRTGLKLTKSGELAPHAKLSDDDVIRIRAMYKKKTKGRTLADVAAKFSCTAAHVHRLVTNKLRA